MEETAKDQRAYLDGVPIGLIATAYGRQATGSTLATLRSIVHALRGWPTPLGAALNTSGGIFKGGQCTDIAATDQFDLVGRQVEFARLRITNPRSTQTGGAGLHSLHGRKTSVISPRTSPTTPRYFARCWPRPRRGLLNATSASRI